MSPEDREHYARTVFVAAPGDEGYLPRVPMTCRAVHWSGLECTRASRHEGDHAAHEAWGDLQVARWPTGNGDSGESLATPPPPPDPAEEMAEHLDGLRDPAAPRDLVAVLDAILAEVPEALTPERSALERLKASVLYTPPEGMPSRWSETALMLYAYIGEPKEPWQRRIAAIFAGTEVPR